MKAAVHTRYGPPDVVQIADVEMPVPEDDGVLIRVRAASVNPLDEGLLKGGGRIVTGLHKPKVARLGVEGAFADYACAPESALVMKPKT